MKKIAWLIASFLLISASTLAQACLLHVPTTVTSGGVTVGAPVIAGTGLLTCGGTSNNQCFVTSDTGTVNTSGAGTSITTSVGVGPPGNTFPAFSPAIFPTAGATAKILSNGGTMAPGNYSTVTADNSVTVSLAAGDYFVNTWSVGNNFTLNVSSGPVRLFINTSFQSGQQGAYNVGGNTANLQIFAYANAQLQFGNENNGNLNANFNGLIYAPFSSTKIVFGNNNVIQGAVLSGGIINLGNNTGIQFGSLVQAAIASIVVADTGGVCYYELSGQANGLTCAAIPLTITACSSNPPVNPATACATPYTGGASGTLSAAGTGMTVNWDGATGGSTGAGFVIPTGGSTVTKYVQVATAGAVTFGVASASPLAANATQCTFGSPMCTFTASLAGFIFSNSATGNTVYTISNQTSGAAQNTSNALWLRAVQASTANAAVCTPAIKNNTVAVNMGYSCNNPATCQAGSLGVINGTPIASAGTAVNLAFDANGSAQIASLRYDDVGQITLTASKTVTPFGGATPVTLNGSSNAFVVKPDHFDLSGIVQTAAPNLANPAAADAAGAKFVKAGEAFSVTVTAKNALGGATPNYGHETAPESVKLTSALAPGLTNNPAIGGAFGAFSNGVATGTAFTWNEAGIIKLTPSIGDGDYLGAGEVTGTQSGNVGRFYAASFAISGVPAIANRTDLCAAPAGCGAFSYMGEQMSAVFSLTAKAVDGTTTLQNYSYSATPANNFAKLNSTAAGNPLGLAVAYASASTAVAAVGATTIAVGSTAGFAVGDALWIPGAGAAGAALSATVTSKTGSTITLNTPVVTAVPVGAKVERDLSARLDTSVAATGNFVSGVANITAPLMLTRGTTNNYYPTLDVGIAPTDSDGAIMAAYDLDAATVAGNDHARVGSTEARYGQIKLTNTHGSELLPLSMTATAQYWDGTNWRISNTDNSTSLTFAATNVVKNGVITGTTTPTGAASMSGGILAITLSRPTGGVGAATINPGSPTYLPLSTGQATFGVYKGSPTFIYMRENY